MTKQKTKRKSYLPKTADGKIMAGPGRPKGTPNKITGQAKENIALVFEGLDGIDGMLKWAKTHLTEFYVNVYPRLIPLQVQGQIDATVKSGDGKLLETAMVDALTRVIDTQRKERSGEIGSGAVGIIIDNVSAAEPVPQLVLSSKTGTKAA